jgi:hypothetical protein
MTTPAQANLYLAQHLAEIEGQGYAVYNPHNKPLDELPWIIGFNNGRSPGWYHAQLIAQDGTPLGGHLCSHEGYMPHDLGVLEGSRPDRHEHFRAHYPNGYRMDFVSSVDVLKDPRIEEAIAAYRKTEETD